MQFADCTVFHLGILNCMRLSAYCSFYKGMVFEDGENYAGCHSNSVFLLIFLAFLLHTKESAVIASTFSGLLSNY